MPGRADRIGILRYRRNRRVTYVTGGGRVETTTTRPNQTTVDARRRTPNDPAPQNESDALASVEGGEPVALPTPRGVVRGLVATFARPGPLAREAVRLGRDSVRIVRGTDEIAPSPKD